MVYNNRFGESSGWIKQSAPYLVKDGNEGQLHQSDLADALQLHGNHDDLVLFRDNNSKLWFLRKLGEIRERGMHFDLQAYSHQVLLDFQVVSGPQFNTLFEIYNGQGIADLGGALEEIDFAPLLQPLRAVINPQTLKALTEPPLSSAEESFPGDQHQETLTQLLMAGKSQPEAFDLDEASQRAKELLITLSNPEKLDGKLALSAMVTTRSAYDNLMDKLESDPRRRYALVVWAILSNLAGPGNQLRAQELNRAISQRKPVVNLINRTLGQLGFTEYESWKATQVIQTLITDLQPLEEEVSPRSLLEKWVEDSSVKTYLEINEYNGIRWFNKEQFENLLWYQRAARLLTLAVDQESDSTEILGAILRQEQHFSAISEAEEKSEYQLDKLIELLDQA